MTPPATVHRSSDPRILAVWCALATLCGAPGCRTAAPERATPSPVAAEQAARHRSVLHRAAPEPVPTNDAAPVATTRVIDLQPRVIVTPEAAHVVLGFGFGDAGSGNALSLAYLAAADRDAASAPDSLARLRSEADALFRALAFMAEVTGVEQLSVAAVFGAPGEPGVCEEITYTRGSDGWRSSMSPLHGDIESTPPVPTHVERDRAGESSAVEVALRFLTHVDHHEFDAAWDLSSVVLQATTSRAGFEAKLRALPMADGDAQRQEAFHSFAPGAFIPGAEMDVLFARPRTLDGLLLRMDDDGQWRIATVMTFARGDRSVAADAPAATVGL